MYSDCNNCTNTACLIKKNLSNGLGQEFLESKRVFKCKRGQHFILEGSPVHGLFFILKGKVKVLRTGINGREQIVRFVKQGEIVGHRGFGIGEFYQIGAVAIEDSILCTFSSSSMNTLLQNNPKICHDFMLFYASELNKSEIKVKKLAQMSVRERVIDTLLYINRKFGQNHEGMIAISLSRKEIAEFAGTTDEQVIRIISALKKEELLTSKGKQLGIPSIEKMKHEISQHNFFLDS